ncbi:hypothetical protein HY638_00920 [Candidatus Woesearchaeota archaeon]|nr:hypothetical protein [Candidatus Woesearchaeota archaeon]
MKRIEYTHKCLFEFPYFKMGQRHYPYIEVDLLYVDNEKKTEDVMCLLDSGADYTVLPKDLGESIGVDFSEMRVVNPPEGISGKISAKCYISPLNINFLGASFLTEVVWIESNDVNPVIGRKGFFDKFDVSFSQSSDKIALVFHSTPKCCFEK